MFCASEDPVRWALPPMQEGSVSGQHSLSEMDSIKSLQTFTSFDPVIPLLGIYYKEIREALQSIIYNDEKFKTKCLTLADRIIFTKYIWLKIMKRKGYKCNIRYYRYDMSSQSQILTNPDNDFLKNRN